jgi:hypothetical protein
MCFKISKFSISKQLISILYVNVHFIFQYTRYIFKGIILKILKAFLKYSEFQFITYNYFISLLLILHYVR